MFLISSQSAALLIGPQNCGVANSKTRTVITMAKIPSDSFSKRAWDMVIVYYIAMRIGIFDSGLGGLIVARAIRRAMPEYDYVYLGDTKRGPYGNRSDDAGFEFTRECVDYLFKEEKCAMVILACNNASACALHKS